MVATPRAPVYADIMPTIEQLQALLNKEPGDTFLMYGIGQEHLKAGAFDQAIEWFDRVISADPHHCYAYYFKARSLEQSGRNKEAADVAREGVAVARARQDMKALSELSALLDELE
ncbi:MAG: hypothetical protein D6692_05340 [Planctomycetota bacterium]|nr:MAG: hypothetical protein D6692_05340 [Planctomycetota bacterium]